MAQRTGARQTYIATVGKDAIKLEDAEGRDVIDEIADTIPVPTNGILQLFDLHPAVDEVDPPRLFDPGHRLVELLPWKELTKAGDSADLLNTVVSALIDPGPGWNTTNVIKSARLHFLDQKQVHGVDCKRLKLSIKGSGPHRDPFNGLPSKSAIVWEAEITLEEETGWIRELIHSHEIVTPSEGSFQDVQMKMDTKNIIKGRAIITPGK